MTRGRARGDGLEGTLHRQWRLWRKPGPAAEVLLATVSVLLLSACGSASLPQAPEIFAQPATTQVNVCGAAEFTVGARSDTPFTYQWYRDGVAIPGATDRRFTLPVASASDDGSHYFVTATNDAGSTRSSEALLTVDARPREPVVLSTMAGHRLSVTPTTIYWTSIGGVYSAPVECGRPVQALYERSSMFESPWGILLANDRVYWTDGNVGWVARVPAVGGPPELVGRTSNPVQQSVNAVVTVGERVYWDNPYGGSIDSTVLTGGPVESVYVAPDSACGPTPIATDGTSLFWAESCRGTVLKMPAAGGSVTVLASGQGWVSDLRHDGEHLYWVATLDMYSDHPRAQVVRVHRDGGVPSVLAEQPGGAWAIAIDPTHVYWTSWPGTALGSGDIGVQSLSRVSRDGSGGIEVVATGLTDALGLAVDANWVYVAELNMGASPGRIVKVAK